MSKKSFVLGPPPEAVSDDALCFVFMGRKMLLRRNGETSIRVPRPDDLRGLRMKAADRTFLGTLDETPCWAVDFVELGNLPEGLALQELRPLLDELPTDQVALASRAAQLLHWRRIHRRCGSCGRPTRDAAQGSGRHCPRCGLTVFPRLSPAIIVAVLKEGRILLARSPRFPKGMYSLLAGFVEPGESLEECVQREVREEVGIEVGDLHYCASQSWPFPDSLMVGFIAEYARGELRVDGDEIEDARWYSSDNLPRLPSKASIARRLIDWFVATNDSPGREAP